MGYYKPPVLFLVIHFGFLSLILSDLILIESQLLWIS
jgi:hypothetical protein